MAKKNNFSPAQVRRIIGAKRSEVIQEPFYYAPKFLSVLCDQLQEKLKSKGGRPGVAQWQIVRKTRYSKKTWLALKQIAARWSRGGTSVSPAQVAARIVEQAVA